MENKNLEALANAALDLHSELAKAKDHQLALAKDLEGIASAFADEQVPTDFEEQKRNTIGTWRETVADIRERHEGERPKTAKQVAAIIDECMQRNLAILFQSPDWLTAAAHASLGRQDKIKTLLSDTVRSAANNVAVSLGRR
jgi:hypothetical protein